MKIIRSILFCFGIAIIIVAAYYYFPYRALPQNTVINKLEVYKSKHEMRAYSQKGLIRTFVIAIGNNPVGPKEFEGDMKTPEGEYFIDSKNPNSDFHKNLGISYPNEKDRLAGKTINRSPGGDVKIHGLSKRYGYLRRFHRWTDWTNGCIAVTNEEMDDLFKHVAIGTRIIIHP